MSKQMTSTAAGDAGAQISASSHSFTVAAEPAGLELAPERVRV